ncbi:MAG: ATP-grasp domain-containing protein [Firmicutes bacterium]|nr:ATP-grasp domain-containing protein [Bacillota bacterium]
MDNIYFIGRRTSDIAASFDGNKLDPFFKGSVTAYGGNTQGNISYNATSGLQIVNSVYIDRNIALYNKFFGDRITEIVKNDKHAKFIPYSKFWADLVPENLKDRIICYNNGGPIDFLESKFNFKNFIKNKIPQPAFEIISGKKILDLIAKGEIPSTTNPNGKRDVVVQVEFGAGGNGTYFATKKYPLDPSVINPKDKYVVSEFTQNKCSLGCSFIITDNGVATYPCGIQIMNGPQFIGSDFHAFTLLDEDIKAECRQVAVDFGNLLRQAYPDLRGFFGLDMIITSEEKPRVFAIETNPRFTGTTSLLNILSHRAGIGSVYEHTHKAFFCGKDKNLHVTLQELLDRITPNARKRYAAPGEEVEGVYKEGLDKTAFQEDGFYTYAVFEEIKQYNIHDDRQEYKAWLGKKQKGKNPDA